MKTKLTKPSAECTVLLHALFDNNQVRDMVVKNDTYWKYKPKSGGFFFIILKI